MLESKMKNICIILVLLSATVGLSGCFGTDDIQPGLEQRFIQETSIIDEYLQDNNLDAQVDNYSTLRFEELLEGNGLAPYTANSVNLTYKTMLLATGDTVEVAENVTIDWDELVVGLQVGLRNVRESGRMILYVPSVLAYGEQGQGDIPPNAILIYDITLNSFDLPQLKNEVSFIQSYVKDSIVATRHPSGIYYRINEPGTGLRPTWGSGVFVDYEGKFIENEERFDGRMGANFNLSSVIQGWQIGLQEIGEGGNIDLFIPSTFGYGEEGRGSIPPNASLRFNIDLISVSN